MTVARRMVCRGQRAIGAAVMIADSRGSMKPLESFMTMPVFTHERRERLHARIGSAN
jgi:hypothetical protein